MALSVSRDIGAFDDAVVLWDFLQLCEEKHGPKLAAAMARLLQSKPTPLEVEFQRFLSQYDEPVIS